MRIHEVRELPLAADLHDRDELAIAGLELGIATDVDDLQLEAVLGLDAEHDVERALAELTLRGAVEPDDPYG